MCCVSVCQCTRLLFYVAMPSQPCCRRSFFLSIHELNQPHASSKPPHLKSLVISISAVCTALVLVLLLVLLFYWFCKSSKSRAGGVYLTDQGQGSLRKLQKFSYRELKKATNGFNETQKLGKGGYGIVYRGLLKSGEEVAVKKLILSSLQGEREFQNELSICSQVDSRYIVKLLGFATHGEKVRLLVYECMQNRSLQEALLEKHTSVHLDWGRRFGIILDIARALAYLHLDCRPSIVHGDIKPSNVLLDGDFRAYLADFGLARTKAEEQRLDQASERFKSDVSENESGTPESSRVMISKPKERGSVERKQSKPALEERVVASFADHSLPSSYLGSPHSGMRFSTDMQAESEIPGSTIFPLAGPQIHQPDQIHSDVKVATGDHSPTLKQHEELMNHRAENGSLDHHMPPLLPAAQRAPPKAPSKDNWWWKQENSGELKVRDYVMEWMRSELSANEDKEASESDHRLSSQHQAMGTNEGIKEKTNRKKERQEQQRKKKMKAMEEELQKEVEQAKKKERAKARAAGRKGREWWKDEYFAELSRKKGLETKGPSANGLSTKGDGGATSPSCVFRLRENYGGERRGRGESTTETVASDDLSSTTTSMRGTVCYVAPEFGGVGVLSEASDIYSFGVLLLVIISGRRPIEIMAANKATAGNPCLGLSPTARRFERANLITWARSLAYSGNVLDLVDDRLHGAYVREQAHLCISLALLCIRRLPSARPAIASVVKVLSGETPPPPLPVEFSPSPPSRLSLHQSPLRAASYVSSSEENV